MTSPRIALTALAALLTFFIAPSRGDLLEIKDALQKTPGIAYRGADGINFTYPATWARRSASAEDEQPDLLVVQRIKDGKVTRAGLSCQLFDFENVPANQKNAETLARETVAAARLEDNRSVVKDIERSDLNGASAFRFALLRQFPDGSAAHIQSLAVDFDDQTYLFVGTCSVEDDDAISEIDVILKSISLGIEDEEDVTVRRTFIHPAAGLRLDIPAYWLDSSGGLLKPQLARWEIFDEDDEHIGIAKFIATRIAMDQTMDEIIEAAATPLRAKGIHVQLEKSPVALAGAQGIAATFHYKDLQNDARVMHLEVIQKADTAYVFSMVCLATHDQQLVDEMKSVIASSKFERRD